jgi:tRNA threonylcarbamoyl adenosine modification protein YjeE
LAVLEIALATERETLALAEALAARLEPGDLIGLEGGLGAGKTTFARGAIHGLGVPEQTPITSPTFALLHQYEGRLSIAHADFYRLNDEAELEELGVEELLDGGTVMFVEWGRKFPSLADRVTLFVELEVASDEARRGRLIPQGARGAALIRDLSPRIA